MVYSKLLFLSIQVSSLETGHLSDTTASAAGSDDEAGSTAATVGSTLRTSPAEHGGSAGSESGGSNVDSVSGKSPDRHVMCDMYTSVYVCVCLCVCVCMCVSDTDIV